MAFRLIIAFLLVCSLLGTNLWGQNQVSFRQLSVKQGLSQNSVVSVAQDSTGFLWFATQDGLNRYDGRGFKTYPFQFTDITRPEYSQLGKLYVDREGKLWVVPSDHTPYFFNAKRDTFRLGAQTEQTSVVFQDRSLGYWFGSYNGRVYRKNNISDKVAALDIPELEGQAIYQIEELGADSLIIVAAQKLIKINHKDGGYETVGLVNSSGVSLAANISSIEFVDDELWIGTFGDGVYHYNPRKGQIERVAVNNYQGYLPRDLVVLDIHLDQQQIVWIASYGRGLFAVDLANKQTHHFLPNKQNPKALHYSDILCIMEDNAGTLWFGTDGAGLSYYDQFLEKFNSYINFQTPEDISIDVVRAITKTKDGAVWIGTSGKGLTRYEPKYNSWTTFTTSNSALPSNRIMSLLADNQDNVWIGTQGGGLSILDKAQNFKNYPDLTLPQATAVSIWSMYQEADGLVWLGTKGQGLVQFHAERGLIKRIDTWNANGKEFKPENIRVVTKDGQGNLWLGTDASGLISWHPENNQTQHFTVHDGNSISDNGIKTLFVKDNQLWVGTAGMGLDVFDLQNERFNNYSDQDGLPNNVIYAILPDREGNLWLSSNKGISKFKPQLDLKDPPQITNYTNYDGLATEFNTGAYYKDPDGSLYFGGLDGFYWFLPEEITENSFQPKTAITSLSVLNKSRPLANDLELKHFQNTLEFTFSSLQYALPEKNEYRYRLIPYESEWVESGNNNFARYTRLPAGSYEFQVTSSNYDGVWNSNTETFAFEILHPWYATRAAYAGYLGLILLLLWSIYRYLKWRWQLQTEMQLQEAETARLKKVDAFKTKLYTDIAHEFRTPLTLIAGPVQEKLRQSDLTSDDRQKFAMVERNAVRLTDLVDQLLELAKLDQGKVIVREKPGNLKLFLKAMLSSFSYQAKSKKIALEIDVTGMDYLLYDEDIIEKIFSNLISNALKHGKTAGACNFTAREYDQGIEVLIKNTADQLSQNEVDQFFDRFYQKDNTQDGAGIGLSLVQELIKLCKGTIDVAFDHGEVIFKVNLPLSKPTTIPDAEPTTVSIPHNDEQPILLLVEDQQEMRAFMHSVLSKLYRIVEASNGQQGLNKALEVIPDVVVSDIRMPIMDGIDLCNALKTDERTSHIPVILLTASNQEEVEMDSLMAKADDFIRKPFKVELLEKRLLNLLEMRQALRQRYSQELVLQAKDIAVTPADEVFLNRVQGVLDEELSNPQFNVQQFCDLIGMSRMQLHRKLMAFTGLSTSAFIRSQRLKQASVLLKTSDLTVNEVAYTVGFNTTSYFIKCFKETYQKTPLDYMQATD